MLYTWNTTSEVMTLTHQSDIDNRKMDVPMALKKTLLQAKDDGRLTCGVINSAELMEVNPDNVMLCIVPESNLDDVTMHIHLTLMEAFCWENDIRLIKVDSAEKLAKLLGDKKYPVNDNDITSGRITTQDYSCICIEHSPDGYSISEEEIVEYYKLVCNEVPHPVVQLPA